MQFGAVLQYGAAGFLTALALCSTDAQMRLPAPPRQSIHVAPLICGRKIEQFVLLKTVDFTPIDRFSMDSLHAFPNGLLLPVSEDAQGVYYQASNGVVVGRVSPPYEHRIHRGGAYVYKTRPGLAYGYIGDARRPDAELFMMSERLRKEALEKFLIGEPGKKSRAPAKQG